MMNKLLLFFLLLSSSTYSASQKYKRGDWKHWVDADHNCLNTRQEILKVRSELTPLLNKKGCKVLRGLWADYYYPQKFKMAFEVDIDHLVPLKHAHLTGGDSWTHSRRMAFANDSENLVITSKKYNRAKGSKGIDTWLPVYPDFACKYVKDWIKIKTKYQLILTAPELLTIETIKSKCQW